MQDQALSAIGRLLAAISTKQPISGYTHNFYRYPARFSPLFVREVIRQYSRPGELILDPFMGGGTAIIEALAMGRKAIGVDLNSLAHFVTTVKTTPLTDNDVAILHEWLPLVHTVPWRGMSEIADPILNLPRSVQRVWADLIALAEWLPLRRQRLFVRCALLKTGQWAIDCRTSMPSKRDMITQFSKHLVEMIQGVQELVQASQKHGVAKPKIRQNRLLLCRSTRGIETDAKLEGWSRPTLVVTSPPYPAVHILYHRWQVQGRRETPAPYWLAALNDGHPASHYTFGSRSTLGLQNYFCHVEQCFRSVRQLVAPNAVVVQLVAFSDAEAQLPRYLNAMGEAGFHECTALSLDGKQRIWRQVPNRKWYCQNGREQDSTKEVVLFHRPS